MQTAFRIPGNIDSNFDYMHLAKEQELLQSENEYVRKEASYHMTEVPAHRVNADTSS
jgi:hypothetical protein